MRLSIMPFLTVFSSQFAAHPQCHQRQVRRPHQHEGAPFRASLAPLAPLPFGWDLATTAEGTPYYFDHNRGITTWEHPELPPYPTAPPKPPKHRLLVLMELHYTCTLQFVNLCARGVCPCKCPLLIVPCGLRHVTSMR